VSADELGHELDGGPAGPVDGVNSTESRRERMRGLPCDAGSAATPSVRCAWITGQRWGGRRTGRRNEGRGSGCAGAQRAGTRWVWCLAFGKLLGPPSI